MVKPGGTGRPRLAISARLAPLPPNRSRSSALPSALPSPKVKTHLPGFTAAAALLPAGFAEGFTVEGFTEEGFTEEGFTEEGLAAVAFVAATFGAAFATGLAGPLFSAFRVGVTGPAFPRTGVDAFDFAAIFFDFATALAMT